MILECLTLISVPMIFKPNSVVMCPSVSGHQLQLSRCQPESRCPGRSSCNRLKTHATWTAVMLWFLEVFNLKVTSGSDSYWDRFSILRLTIAQAWYTSYFPNLQRETERLTQLYTSSPSRRCLSLLTFLLFQEGKKNPILSILVFIFFPPVNNENLLCAKYCSRRKCSNEHSRQLHARLRRQTGCK